MSETVRVWLVERTYSDDEQNLIILTYATPDGRREFRKERALTLGEERETLAGLDVSSGDLSEVSDPERREWFATEATRVAERHDPEDAV